MKYYVEDPPREKHQSIEKSPQDYFPKIEIKTVITNQDIDSECEKMPMFKTQREIDNEKDTSETATRKPKKNNRKTDKSAMA